MLCDGDCGNVYREEDLNSTCYGDWYCNDCMFTFIAGQDYHRLSEYNVPWSKDDYRKHNEIYGGGDPFDYE